MDTKITEEFEILMQDEQDARAALKVDEDIAARANEDVAKSKVRWAEAIIALDKFKKKHKIVDA